MDLVVNPHQGKSESNAFLTEDVGLGAGRGALENELFASGGFTSSPIRPDMNVLPFLEVLFHNAIS